VGQNSFLVAASMKKERKEEFKEEEK